MKLTPKIVGIAGRKCEWYFYGEDITPEEICFAPSEWVKDITAERCEKGIYMTGMCLKKGRGIIEVDIKKTRYRIPCAIFGEKEFFLCMVISSNFHYGYDPSAYEDADITVMRNAVGNGFDKAAKELLPIYRKHNLPVTWLIDPIVGFFKKKKLTEWHESYGDDYGIMPTSNFFLNTDNYNTQHSQTETDEFFSRMKSLTEYSFPYYTQIAGIDQWVGSVGGHFVKSCEKAGIRGLWGLGYDHGTCDTSMFHRGCPWDVYKMDLENFRRPDAGSGIWGFQWTTRDILNTVHCPGGISGAAIFSTDADDIFFHNVLQTEKEYYKKMLECYKKNMDRNEYFIFLMHQEDHDTHHMACNRYYEQFLDSVLPDEEITPATMQEITMWLDLKFGRGQHPAQMIRMEDILEDPSHVVFEDESYEVCGKIVEPADWGRYEPVWAYYDENIQAIYECDETGKPGIFPYRVYDYRKSYPFEEEGEWPMEDYSGIREVKVQQNAVFIISDTEYLSVPLLINQKIVYCDIRKGENWF